jgi:hypothetical protein
VGAETIQIGDLIRALGHGRATFVAQVASGSTATTINLAGLNLGSANLAGNLVLLDAGALGAGSAPTIATISSNTATSLTVPALSQAPATGANLWIFAVATVQANIAENVAQWGGQPVAPADVRGGDDPGAGQRERRPVVGYRRCRSPGRQCRRCGGNAVRPAAVLGEVDGLDGYGVEPP